jgi:hypothetical protein
MIPRPLRRALKIPAGTADSPKRLFGLASEPHEAMPQGKGQTVLEQVAPRLRVFKESGF